MKTQTPCEAGDRMTGSREHALHRMTAQYRCVDCDRTETDLHQSGSSVSGYDPEYAPK